MKKDLLFEKVGTSIVIPLNYRGYLVRADIKKDYNNNNFFITYEIGYSGSSYWNCIEGDTFTLHLDKSINYEVYKFTMDKFAEGYFKPFLDRYDFEFLAMNRGIEVLEAENTQ